MHPLKHHAPALATAPREVRPTVVGILAGGSESFRKANAHLVGYGIPSPNQVPPPAPIQKKRIRQCQGDGMNKWEREWRDRIAPFYEHIHREVSLPLANGLRYKVDFLCVDQFGAVFGHEVKGIARATGIAKLKMAAALYPWIAFRLVTKRGQGRDDWDVEDVAA
jgi:hypothetical protein